MNSKEFRKTSLAAGVVVFLAWLGAAGEVSAQGFKVIRVCTSVDVGPNTLIQAPDGFFYGTSLGGGIGFGSVFKMDAAGNVSTIHSFAGPPTDGQSPKAGLFLNSDGLFYGTTSLGGSDDAGTIFQIDATGATYSVQSLVCSNTAGAGPVASFFKANDGHLYLPMSICGQFTPTNDSGTVDSVSTTLTATRSAGFYAFGNITTPYGHVVQGADGDLYGIASGSYAPTGFAGGIYRVTPGNDTPEVLHNFNGFDGAFPVAPLVLANDGNFYGTTQVLYNPNFNPTGTIFELTADGAFSTVHFFSGSEGADPQSGLIQASDNFLYGVTTGGGTAGLGTIYRIDTLGNFTLLASAADVGLGQAPISELLEGSDGKLYGTTAVGGGLNVDGTIYTIDLTQTIDAITPNSGPASGATPVTIAGAGFVAGATVNIGTPSATGVSVPDAAHVQATTPANNPGTILTVRVVLPDTTAIVLNNGWFSDFLDVPTGDIFHDFVRKLLFSGITAGCGGGNYCRDSAVTRAQMAVFLLKAEHGSRYVPPVCTGLFFDVPCTPGTGFSDWIEELSNEGITGGCGGGNYCPGNPVTRQQMAVFLLKTEHGSAYAPPLCAAIFGDVPCPSQFANWIERLYAENVTGGCQASPLLYCPASPVLRGQMAPFLSKTFNLP
jgi:uncharacterized repeat protein (TIGR03803 family)